MDDHTVLDAIEAALSSPVHCGCGDSLTVVVRDDAAWLECAAFATPSRLPAPVAAVVRDLLHDRRRIIDLPVPEARAA